MSPWLRSLSMFKLQSTHNRLYFFTCLNLNWKKHASLAQKYWLHIANSKQIGGYMLAIHQQYMKPDSHRLWSFEVEIIEGFRDLKLSSGSDLEDTSPPSVTREREREKTAEKYGIQKDKVISFQNVICKHVWSRFTGCIALRGTYHLTHHSSHSSGSAGVRGTPPTSTRLHTINTVRCKTIFFIFRGSC